VEKVVFDENVKIKKYYIFRSQFDVQIFSNLSFARATRHGVKPCLLPTSDQSNKKMLQ